MSDVCRVVVRRNGALVLACLSHRRFGRPFADTTWTVPSTRHFLVYLSSHHASTLHFPSADVFSVHLIAELRQLRAHELVEPSLTPR